MDAISISVSLVLLIIANGVPVLASDILKSCCAWPVDGGRHFIDGNPCFGTSKTWRGIVVAVVATALAGEVLNIGWQWGMIFGVLAMTGDLLSSFIKRRLAITISGRALGLDQIPESALPVLLLKDPLGLSSYIDAFWVIFIFFVLDVTVSPLLYKLHIRKRPY